jgi:maltooligosyltrehalose trehalohydrolase
MIPAKGPSNASSSDAGLTSSVRGEAALRRRLPIGVEPAGNGRVHARVWAAGVRTVEIVVNRETVALAPEGGGYFSGFMDARPGDLYAFRLDGSEKLYPDPASRFQPVGPHGWSQIVDPAFPWTDAGWSGVRLEGQVIYELHVGTFTREGTWGQATEQLAELASIGITVVEVMPLAEFEGRFGWGYDGVDLFAPSHRYGVPDDVRRFVDRAHALGVGVILDVVYNHLGPVGNYLRAFSPSYFTDRHENEWGEAINFDGEGSGPVREFFIANAGYWIDEFHFDGLRLDATQQIFDSTRPHILAQIGEEVRRRAAARSTIIVAENEPQDTALVRPVQEGGCGLDAVWNDDLHHSAMVALTGRAEAYYSDTSGEPQELISAAKYGYLFQGQHYEWQRAPRGTPALDLPPTRFVAFLQNHDQVANSGHGRRGHQLTSPGRWRAMTALFLLLPATPMLFQGQEFAASSPFLYFADLEEPLATNVRRGRGEFLLQFPSLVDLVAAGQLDDPGSESTFERSKLDFSEREKHAGIYALHRDLLRLRREHLAFRAQARGGVDGAVLAPQAFALRFFADQADDRLLIVNLGADLQRASFAEPLIAPPAGLEWTRLWSSEDAKYGGGGIPELRPDGRWHLPAESAVILGPERRSAVVTARVRRRTA